MGEQMGANAFAIQTREKTQDVKNITETSKIKTSLVSHCARCLGFHDFP